MTIQERLDLLAELGHYLTSGGDSELDEAILRSYIENKWFTDDNSRKALKSLADNMLQRDTLQAWVDACNLSDRPFPDKTVGLIMAGNLPLVGFHDWLCVFVAGQRARVKLSDKDKRLLPLLVKKMGEWNHESWAYTEFLQEEDKLSGFDAVIATGSNNSARYFEQYFKAYPHIIRRNRNGVAVLTGQETDAELYALGNDIFSYFGLGCRNVSKLYVPTGYNFERLLEILHEYNEIVHHDKYKNNFDYNMTLFILNNMPFLNNGCLLLREDEALQSRIASAHYSFYEDKKVLAVTLAALEDQIQCVVSSEPVAGFPHIPFGKSQQPGLADYADGVDVMAFLNSL